MSSTPLFSTYRQGENRVTSSMLAVFNRIGLSLAEEILAKASGEATLETVTLTNQPRAAKRSIPEVRISADFIYLFEVKTSAARSMRSSFVVTWRTWEEGRAGTCSCSPPTPFGPLLWTLCRTGVWCGSASPP